MQRILNYGGLYTCEERIDTVVLYNRGCAPLTLVGDSNDNDMLSVTATYPIIIPPGDSTTAEILVDPHGPPSFGRVIFISDSGGMVPISIEAGSIPPAQLHLALSQPQSGENRDVVTFYLTLTGTGNDSAVNAITFDLMHNNDLLSFLSASGVTITGTGGRRRYKCSIY